MMKKIALLVLLSFLGWKAADAQEYKVALGLKGGIIGAPYQEAGSVDVKWFFAGMNALEGRVGFAPNFVFAQALYERNFNIAEGFNWYLGAGLNAGAFTYPYGHAYYYNDHYYNDGGFVGIDFLGGLEYTFPFRLNLAADLGPTVRVGPYVQPGVSANIAARYAFK